MTAKRRQQSQGFRPLPAVDSAGARVFLQRAQESRVDLENAIAGARWLSAASIAEQVVISALDACLGHVAGYYYQGDDHSQAVRELELALKKSARWTEDTERHLAQARTVLSRKSRVQYNPTPVRAEDARLLATQAARVLAWVESVVG